MNNVPGVVGKGAAAGGSRRSLHHGSDNSPMSYHAAIMHAIEDLRDRPHGSSIASIRKHVCATLRLDYPGCLSSSSSSSSTSSSHQSQQEQQQEEEKVDGGAASAMFAASAMATSATSTATSAVVTASSSSSPSSSSSSSALSFAKGGGVDEDGVAVGGADGGGGGRGGGLGGGVSRDGSGEGGAVDGSGGGGGGTGGMKRSDAGPVAAAAAATAAVVSPGSPTKRGMARHERGKTTTFRNSVFLRTLKSSVEKGELIRHNDTEDRYRFSEEYKLRRAELIRTKLDEREREVRRSILSPKKKGGGSDVSHNKAAVGAAVHAKEAPKRKPEVAKRKLRMVTMVVREDDDGRKTERMELEDDDNSTTAKGELGRKKKESPARKSLGNIKAKIAPRKRVVLRTGGGVKDPMETL